MAEMCGNEFEIGGWESVTFSCERPAGHKGRHRATSYDTDDRQRSTVTWTTANPVPRPVVLPERADPLGIPAVWSQHVLDAIKMNTVVWRAFEADKPKVGSTLRIPRLSALTPPARDDVLNPEFTEELPL